MALVPDFPPAHCLRVPPPQVPQPRETSPRFSLASPPVSVLCGQPPSRPLRTVLCPWQSPSVPRCPQRPSLTRAPKRGEGASGVGGRAGAGAEPRSRARGRRGLTEVSGRGSGPRRPGGGSDAARHRVPAAAAGSRPWAAPRP